MRTSLDSGSDPWVVSRSMVSSVWPEAKDDALHANHALLIRFIGQTTENQLDGLASPLIDSPLRWQEQGMQAVCFIRLDLFPCPAKHLLSLIRFQICLHFDEASHLKYQCSVVNEKRS